MPIISNFPTGGGSGGGGLALGAVSNIATVVSHGKAYFKWTDPEDMVVAGSTLAAWGGTLLVRKAGSMPSSRRDGTVVLDSKTRNAYQDSYFCDSGLTDGVTYYYKFFPYTTANAYTDSTDDEFSATPTAQVVGIDSWNVTNMAASSEAGDGKMTIKWTDPAATITSDGVTLATWASTTVVVKAGSYPTGKDDANAVFTKKVTTRNQYSSNALTVTGLTNGTKYYIAFYPETTDGGINTNTVQRTTGTANKITISTVPSQSGTLTYNGSSQTPSWSNYNSAKMTLSVTGQTNAGTYFASFVPTANYRWSDGSTTVKSVRWTIAKAAGSLSLSASSVVLNSNAKTKTVTVTRAGDGAITATSSNTTVATVSVSGSVVTIKSVNDKTGTATITVKVAAGTNHTAPSNKTCAVSCEFLPAIGTALNDISWADIKRISDAGLASSYFAVGDRKAVTLSGTVGSLSLSGTYYCYIIGIDHNSGKEGTNRIHFQFGYSAASGGVHLAFIDSGYNSSKTSGAWFNMNNANSNSGGWKSSLMKTVICPAFKSAMPSDLQAVLKATTKYSDNTGGGFDTASYVTATSEEVFLLAEFEVFGTRSYANSTEQNYQAQYAWYSAGNSKVRYRHSATSSTAGWWLRSVRADYSSGFCRVSTSGSAAYGTANISYGFAPAFCV